MALAEALQHAIRNDDLEAIQASLAQIPFSAKPATLKECLVLAMHHRALEATKFLFGLGAKLRDFALWRAIEKENTDVLQALLDAGWNINSTEFGIAAIQ